MDIVLSVLIGVMVFCGYLVLDQMRMQQKRKASLRMRIAPDGSEGVDFEDKPLLGLNEEFSGRAKSIAFLLKALGVNVDEAIRKLDHRFAQAGITSIDAPIYYLFFQRVVALFLLIGALSLMMADGNRLLNMTLGLFLGVVALFGPHMFVKNLIDRRKKTLQRSFPDTLDLLLVCVESGLALDAALNRVCSELGRAYPEITGELNRTRLELALINDRVRALMNLGDRTNMVAFRSLVAALIQSERFGTSLTDTLRVLSEDFRLMRLSEAEAKAARLPVLLTIPLILLLIPAFLIIVLGPAVINFMRHGGPIFGGN